MNAHAIKLGALAALVALASCSKKSTRRDQIVECSGISLDAKGTVQCLVGLYHWKLADAQKAADARARELDSIKTWQEDSVWAIDAAKHKRDLQKCGQTDDQLKSCLLVSGWPLKRVNAARDSIWNSHLAQRKKELQTCMAKRDFNLSSCLTLYYKWDPDRALATADSVTRARLGR
jgi:hypothetical protein